MNMKRTVLILTAVLLLAAALTAAALSLRVPFATNGRYEKTITDRVHFTVEPTRFVLEKPNAGEECAVSFVLKAKKEEADFYGVIHSAVLNGEYLSAVFEAQTEQENVLLQEYPLAAENGAAVESVWKVTVRFIPKSADPVDFTLTIDYSAGLNEASADEHLIEIPISVQFE